MLAHAVDDRLIVPELETVGEPELDPQTDVDPVKDSDAVVVHTTETVLALYVHDTLDVGEVVVDAEIVDDGDIVVETVAVGDSEADSVGVAHAVDVIDDVEDTQNDVEILGENEPDEVPHNDGVELEVLEVVMVLDCDTVSHEDFVIVPQKLPDVE